MKYELNISIKQTSKQQPTEPTMNTSKIATWFIEQTCAKLHQFQTERKRGGGGMRYISIFPSITTHGDLEYIADVACMKKNRFYAVEDEGCVSANEVISDLISDTGLSNQSIVSAWINDSITLSLDIENLIRWYLIDGAILVIGGEVKQTIHKLMAIIGDKSKNPRNFQVSNPIVEDFDVIVVRLFGACVHDGKEREVEMGDAGGEVLEVAAEAEDPIFFPAEPSSLLLDNMWGKIDCEWEKANVLFHANLDW